MISTAKSRPWLARRDWAKGEVESKDKLQIIYFWVFALIWNGGVGFALWHLASGVRRETAPLLFLSVFVLLGILLLIGAIYVTARWFKFGNSVFKMMPVPGVVGGQLSGAIQTSKKLCPADGFRLRLRCVRRYTTGSGKQRRTSDETLWQEEKIVMKELGDETARSVIPVYFHIPFSCRETDTSNRNEIFRWFLDMEAELPGVDYKTRFEVPVFKTEKSSSEIPVADPLRDYKAPPMRQLPASSGIRTRELPTGEKEFSFAAARNPGSALTMSIISVIFLGAMCFIYIVALKDLPVVFRVFACLFPGIFGLFGLLFGAIAASLWLKSSRVLIGQDDVSLHNSYIFFSRTRRIPLSAVAGIDTAVRMSSGENSYQSIDLVLKDSKPVCIGENIKDPIYTDFLVREMKAALKLNK